MMISLDLDGTLLDSNKKVPKSTREYLNQLKNKGEIIVLNTGRVIQRALKAIEDAYFANYVISDTGALVYDADSKTVINQLEIDREIGRKLFELAKNRFDEFTVFTSSNYYKYLNKKREVEENCVLIDDYKYILDNTLKISHIAIDDENEEDLKEFIMANQDSFKELKMFVMWDSFGTKKWIEVIRKEAGKFNALVNLAKTLNVKTEDIISFGDSINDIEMMKYSGIGVAMKNAIPQIKESANFITEYTNDELGVEMWLRKYFV